MDKIILVKAKTLEECFKDACYKIVDNIKKENNSLKLDDNKSKIVTKTIFAEGRDIKSLLYNLLEEVLFYFEEDNFFITEIKEIEIRSILGAKVKTNTNNRYRHYKVRMDASGKEHKIDSEDKKNLIPSILKESIKFKQEKNDFIFEIIIKKTF